jgi:predicted  nucleic acid-binding Zn-ribbon protein
MTLTQAERLKKEVAQAVAVLQSEKKKNQALESKIQTLKEERKQLQKAVESLEGKIGRSKERNVKLKLSLREEVKKKRPQAYSLSNG